MRNARGFSLVEVMIACLVTSVGLCGIALLSLASVLLTNQSTERTLAIMLAADLLEIASLSPGYQAELTSALSTTTPTCQAGSTCIGDVFLAANLAGWQRRLGHDLPGPSGILCRDSSPNDGDGAQHDCDGAGPMVLKVFWGDEHRYSLRQYL